MRSEEPKPQESEADRVARLTRVIVQETEGQAHLLLGLIERRAPGVTASDAASFILTEWRKGGDERARLLDHAMKTDEHLAMERELAEEMRAILAPLAGRGFSSQRIREIRREVVTFMRKKLPDAPVAVLVEAAADAIDMRDKKIVLRTDGLVLLLRGSGAPLQS